jgi:hypothetical protein
MCLSRLDENLDEVQREESNHQCSQYIITAVSRNVLSRRVIWIREEQLRRIFFQVVFPAECEFFGLLHKASRRIQGFFAFRPNSSVVKAKLNIALSIVSTAFDPE